MYSTVGTIDPIAVEVDLPGQKPCCSVLYKLGMYLLSRNTKILLIIRYQIEVTDIGRSCFGSEGSRSYFGIAVSSVVRRTSSQLPWTSYHKNDCINYASSSCCKRNLIAYTSIPNTPTADLTRIPETASRSSFTPNSPDNS